MGGDFNGDGLTDIVRTMSDASGASQILFSNGDGTFTNGPNFTLTPTSNRGISYWNTVGGDFNGDGLTDIVRTMSDATGSSQVLLRMKSMPNAVSSIVDGIGPQTQLTFKPLTDTSVYTKGTTATYPELDLQAPMYIVTQVDTDNGQGGTHSTTYKYGGLKAHLKGRGLLGFAWMESTNQQIGIVTKTEYRQDSPYTGQVSRTEQRKPTGELLGETTATFAQLTSHNGKIHFPYVDLSTNKSSK